MNLKMRSSKTLSAAYRDLFGVLLANIYKKIDFQLLLSFVEVP